MTWLSPSQNSFVAFLRVADFEVWGADSMTVLHLTRNADSLPKAMFGSSKLHAVTSHKGDLIKTRLREALFREDALIYQMVELIHQQEALTKLLGSGSDAVDRIRSLTPREQQIMGLILAGQPNKNIAVDIGISQRTVENHPAAVMRKTGSKSVPALVRFALAAVWYRVCKHEPEIEFIVPMTQIEKPRDNDNSRFRRCGTRST